MRAGPSRSDQMSDHSFTHLAALVEAFMAARHEAPVEGFAELPDLALQQLLRQLLLGRLEPNQLPRDLLSSDEMWVRQAAPSSTRCVVYATARDASHTLSSTASLTRIDTAHRGSGCCSSATPSCSRARSSAHCSP